MDTAIPQLHCPSPRSNPLQPHFKRKAATEPTAPAAFWLAKEFDQPGHYRADLQNEEYGRATRY